MGTIAESGVAFILIAIATSLTAWMAGAIYYDVCRASGVGGLAAVAWVAGVVLLFVSWQPLWQPFAALLAVWAFFLVWWSRLRPSHDREWDPAVAVLPRAMMDEDVITFQNVRNFDYRSADEFTQQYEDRTFRLANLRGADVIFFNWGSRLMSHPVLVFDFGADGRVCMSIEVRYRKGQKFSIVRSLYRQQELIFVVADERDVILRRTKFGRPQTAHLYRLTAETRELQAVFLDLVAATNRLYDMPRWYHGLCTNCTTTFYRMPHRRLRLGWQVLANAHLDESLYAEGLLDRSLPFQELRRTAHLNEIANNAPAEGFGDHLRTEIEKRRHA